MTTIPPVLIVTDKGHFVAYHVTPQGGAPRVIETAVFSEGVDKLSEQFTDKAGGFPNGGTNGKGNSAAERMTLVAEMEMRCFRHIQDRIISVLTEHPGVWGFAAPSEINSAILDDLPPRLLERLHINLPKDLARVPAVEIPDRFLRAAAA